MPPRLRGGGAIIGIVCGLQQRSILREDFTWVRNNMKIAQVAPLAERVPPVEYGGTERIVSYLTETLVAQGHDVALFASGDSLTTAKLIAPCGSALRLNANCVDGWAYNFLLLEKVFQHADSFDVIHFHIDYLHFPLSRRHTVPHVTTLHGRLDIPELIPLYQEFADVPVVSISNAQRSPLPWANWQRTVYHGLPRDLYKLNEGSGNYLAFLGRISPEKRVDRAIEIAKRANMKLKIAAKVDTLDRHYMESEIAPLLDHPLIDFVGEIGDQEKCAFVGNAYALLFPIDWCEPFGLVMIEAMACGTPVVAYSQGSVPEVVDDHVTGFLVHNIEESLDALDKIEHFDRQRCRETFEQRFTADRMANDYVRVYENLLPNKRRAHPRRRTSSQRAASAFEGEPVSRAASSREIG
jgi:glycosyltransferase involved in cell wall biosynthesis